MTRKNRIATVGAALSLVVCGALLPPRPGAGMTPPLFAEYAGTGPRVSHGGAFRAELDTGGRYVADQPTSWTVRVASCDGQPVENADLEVRPWYPELRAEPGPPLAVHTVGAGQYRVDDLRLEPGLLNLKVKVQAPGVTDSLAFNLVLRRS